MFYVFILVLFYLYGYMFEHVEFKHVTYKDE